MTERDLFGLTRIYADNMHRVIGASRNGGPLEQRIWISAFSEDVNSLAREYNKLGVGFTVSTISGRRQYGVSIEDVWTAMILYCLELVRQSAEIHNARLKGNGRDYYFEKTLELISDYIKQIITW